MHCDQCGVEVNEQSIYCHKCGHRLGEPATEKRESTQQRFMDAAESKMSRDTPEEELWQGTFSPKAMVGTWIMAGIVTIGGVVVGILTGLLPIIVGCLVLLWLGLALWLGLRRWDVSYRLTNQRLFVYCTGYRILDFDRIEVIDMDDVSCTQGIIERMLGVGTIKITSSDLTHPELLIPGIENAQQVAQMMDDARRAERLRRGLHIEAV